MASGSTPASAEVGVSAQEITVAVLIFDLGGVARAGLSAAGADAESQRRMYESYIADVNDDGGVAGRKMKPVYVNFDPLDADDRRRACIVATEDTEAFAVLANAGFTGDDALCVAELHRVPLIAAAR